jgi:protein disulfide-isomerase-like protein
MARFAVTLVCLAALLAGAAASTKFEDKNLVELKDDFEEKVLDGRLYALALYAPWCGHCKRLAPVWKELGEAYAADPDVVIAHVDCTVQRDTCNNLEVRGYPTIKVIRKGQLTNYEGARDFKSFKKFIDEHKAKMTQSTA